MVSHTLNTPSFGVPDSRRFASLRQRARQRRANLFLALMRPMPTDRILDLGGGTGRHIVDLLPGHDPRLITVADTSQKSLSKCRYGFNTVKLEEGATQLPFGAGEFDIVFCSSVIEHATVPRSELYTCPNFERRSKRTQAELAAEIMRIGRRYFVQTPYKHFPIEAHSLLPSVIFLLPRRAQIAVLKVTRKFWVKRTPDYLLFDRRRLQSIFPAGRVVAERWFGLTKSIIAVGW